MSRLQRRDVFLQFADPLTKAGFAFDVIGAVLGLVALPLAILALARGKGRRSAFAVMFLVVKLYIATHVLDATLTALSAGDEAVQESVFTVIDVLDNLTSTFTDLFLLIAAFMVLHQRAARFHQAQPQIAPGYGSLRKFFEAIAFALLFLLSTAATVMGNVGINLYDSESIGSDWLSSLLNATNDLFYVYTFFYLMMIIYLIIAAVLLKSKMAAAGLVDKPTNTILAVVSPLFLLHGLYWLFFTVFFGVANHMGTISLASQNDVELVTTIEFALVPAALIFALLALGCSSSKWTTFGAAETGGARSYNMPVYAGPPAQQMPYGQQPAFVQQPVYGHQPYMPPAVGEQPYMPPQQAPPFSQQWGEYSGGAIGQHYADSGSPSPLSEKKG